MLSQMKCLVLTLHERSKGVDLKDANNEFGTNYYKSEMNLSEFCQLLENAPRFTIRHISLMMSLSSRCYNQSSEKVLVD